MAIWAALQKEQFSQKTLLIGLVYTNAPAQSQKSESSTGYLLPEEEKAEASKHCVKHFPSPHRLL